MKASTSYLLANQNISSNVRSLNAAAANFLKFCLESSRSHGISHKARAIIPPALGNILKTFDRMNLPTHLIPTTRSKKFWIRIPKRSSSEVRTTSSTIPRTPPLKRSVRDISQSFNVAYPSNAGVRHPEKAGGNTIEREGSRIAGLTLASGFGASPEADSRVASNGRLSSSREQCKGHFAIVSFLPTIIPKSRALRLQMM